MIKKKLQEFIFDNNENFEQNLSKTTICKFNQSILQTLCFKLLINDFCTNLPLKLNFKNKYLNFNKTQIEADNLKNFVKKIIDCEYRHKKLLGEQCSEWLVQVSNYNTSNLYKLRTLGHRILCPEKKLNCFYILKGFAATGKST